MTHQWLVVSALQGRWTCHPIFLISNLSLHFAALEVDARASLLLGEPDKGDPFAHPRMTVTGRVARAADKDILGQFASVSSPNIQRANLRGLNRFCILDPGG